MNNKKAKEIKANSVNRADYLRKKDEYKTHTKTIHPPKKTHGGLGARIKRRERLLEVKEGESVPLVGTKAEMRIALANFDSTPRYSGSRRQFFI